MTPYTTSAITPPSTYAITTQSHHLHFDTREKENNPDKMEPQSPAGEWFPGPEYLDQPYPIINDISGTCLKTELVVPPHDRVSQGAFIKSLGVLKLAIPDPKVWLLASYVIVRTTFLSAGRPSSSPSCGSICEENTGDDDCRGDARDDNNSITSHGSLEDCFTTGLRGAWCL
ncbi:hypothetical protein SMACR_12783 [Sordaria macrospora]|uniref:Uncharacterized protein n=1 Tax=Sordaria macrospora TaxID=5147 RepID=A0A8S8ZL90_SORMA|nr:hypothetical protein SMACR_12783 [Sordaria macrospora]WPJ64153.1 hypothetical protein SMAC4_12783 [Sordaria macrospora]